jgi:hypothetical protein
MKRRGFLQAAALTGAALALPYHASARTTALRGFGCNDQTPSHVNPLSPDWFHIEFGAWCWDQNATYGATKVAYRHYTNVPLASEISATMQHPNYDGWHILGANEAVYNGWTPVAYAANVTAEALAILAVNPLAKFVIEGGMQKAPLYEDNSWFDQVWALIPKATVRSKIRAIQTNFYIQQKYPNNPERWFDAMPIGRYFQKCREGLDDRDLPERELWCGEIGLYKSQYVLDNPVEAANYVATVDAECSAWCNRWAWYSFMNVTPNSSSYVTLRDYATGITSAGLVFAGL